MLLDIIIIFLLQLINGFFSMYELSLMSSSRIRLENMVKRGNKHAKTVLLQLKEPEKVLSAIQIGITLIGIISGVYGGGVLSNKIEPIFAHLPWIGEYASHFTMVVVVAVITFMSLLVGELVPKSIAISNPEKIAVSTTVIFAFLMKITYPLVILLSSTTHLINRLLRVKKHEHNISEEEIKMILHKSSEQGVLEKNESRMISDVLSFTDRHISELMVPRGEVVYMDASLNRKQTIEYISRYHYSKYILTQGSLDKILGIVYVKDIILMMEKKQTPFNLRPLARPPLYIYEYLLAGKVLDIFRSRKKKMGVVINEYGMMVGIATLHDLVEEVFGKLPDIDQIEDVKLRHNKKGFVVVDGIMSITDFMRSMKMGIADELLSTGINTVGGMALYLLHDLPKEGDSFIYNELKFTVTKIEQGRVDKLTVKRR